MAELVALAVRSGRVVGMMGLEQAQGEATSGFEGGYALVVKARQVVMVWRGVL